jgi:NDP-sugar pyrophosphorylase family protein
MSIEKVGTPGGTDFTRKGIAAAAGSKQGVAAPRAGVTGVILAGTQSWGDCALESALPRALAPIVNRPLLAHVLDWLDRNGVVSAHVCGSRHTHTMRRALSPGSGVGRNGRNGCEDESAAAPTRMALEYYEDIAPRGPAGSIRDAGMNSDCDTLIAVDGTVIPCVDADKLLDAHHRAGAGVTVVVSREARSGRVGGDGLAPTGVYVFSRAALEKIPALGYADIKETLIPRLYADGVPVLTFRSELMAPRVTGVDSYLAVNAWALTRWVRGAVGVGVARGAESIDGYESRGSALVHRTASVEKGAKLIGPVLVGPRTVIGRGATIVGPTTLGAGCRIGEQAVICRSAIWDDCVVTCGTILDSCIMTHASQAGSEASGLDRASSDLAYRYVVFSGDVSRVASASRMGRRGGQDGSNGSGFRGRDEQSANGAASIAVGSGLGGSGLGSSGLGSSGLGSSGRGNGCQPGRTTGVNAFTLLRSARTSWA